MTTQGYTTPRAVSPLTTPPQMNNFPPLRRSHAMGLGVARNLIEEFNNCINPNITNEQISTYINNRKQKFGDTHPETFERYSIDPITYENYENDTEVVSMSCGHYFEHTALFNWFVRSQELKCPTCRCNDNSLVRQNTENNIVFYEENFSHPQFVWRINPINGAGYHSYEFSS